MLHRHESLLFWNSPPAFSLEGAIDPLGFDALREAMSNFLVPYLTGATSHAEHYIAVVTGLRWASDLASSPDDEKIWQHFSRFERGLKQYWHRHPRGRPSRSKYLGKRRVAVTCTGPRPNVEAPILADQRGVGILGNYIESLRAIGLVKGTTLCVDDATVDRLLGDRRFRWNAKSPVSWDELDRTFEAVDQKGAWPRLGRLLFNPDSQVDAAVRMCAAARVVRGTPVQWGWEALSRHSAFGASQRTIAGATALTLQLEAGVRGVFASILDGDTPSIPRATRALWSRLAQQLLDRDVIGIVWPREPLVSRSLGTHLEFMASKGATAKSVLHWHQDLMQIRSGEPWVHALGERSTMTLPASRVEPDFRIGNVRTLLRETRWQG
jgi:hypothetical protein